MSPDVRLASAPDPFVRGADERRVVEGLGQRVLEPPLFPASGGGILRHQLQKGSAPVHQEGRLRGAIQKTVSRTVALILVVIITSLQITQRRVAPMNLDVMCFRQYFKRFFGSNFRKKGYKIHTFSYIYFQTEKFRIF